MQTTPKTKTKLMPRNDVNPAFKLACDNIKAGLDDANVERNLVSAFCISTAEASNIVNQARFTGLD